MPALFVRAIITGFGLRLGSEIAKIVAHRLLPTEEPEEEDEELGSTTSEPPAV